MSKSDRHRLGKGIVQAALVAWIAAAEPAAAQQDAGRRAPPPGASGAEEPAIAADAAPSAETLLGPVAEALSIGAAGRLRIVASGSGYEADSSAAPEVAATVDGSAEQAGPVVEGPKASPTPGHFRIPSHVEETDLATGEIRIERVRAPGSPRPGETGETPETLTIPADAPWRDRARYWTSPHGFVSGALEGGARAATETLAGTAYRVVAFTVEGGREVRGYFDSEGRLAKTRTTVEDGAGEPMELEASYLDWRELGDLTYPTTLIRKRDGELAEVLIVKEVTAERAGSSP